MPRSPSKNKSSAHSSEELAEQSSERLLDQVTPRSLLLPVRAVSFWAAVAMPFLYLPLLMTGLDTPFETVAFLSLVVANIGTLIVGHGYHN